MLSSREEEVQIIAFDRECLYLIPLFGVKPSIVKCKIWPQKLETIF